ncbi:MAG: Gfo/Idh/MocA family oxidoreductase [Cyclobacteriaceae bacterium]|nr:Gfo/Idh/MocA family oxidoreductase [Cyclobacteriaceae bacterium]
MKRRAFLRNATTGLLTLSAAGSFANILLPRAKGQLGVALVGLGYYSTDLLAPALQLTTQCKLTGIVTGTPAKAELWQQRHELAGKNIYNYSTFDTIANNPDIDVVYIVLPPSMHAEYTIRAANAGKHVWCEKPMAVSVAECEAMINACRKNKVALSIGYRMHHEPNTQQIIRFAREKKYGAVRKVFAAAGYHEGRRDHWKQKRSMGGGALMDMGVYSLNAARYATQAEPIAVTATQSTTRPDIYREVDETTTFDLEFPNGTTAHCETSFGKGMNDLRVECTNGWYALSPFQAYSGVRGVTSDGIRLEAAIENEQTTQMDDDALAIMQGKKMLVPGEEGLRDIRIVEAIRKSVAGKSRVVL